MEYEKIMVRGEYGLMKLPDLITAIEGEIKQCEAILNDINEKIIREKTRKDCYEDKLEMLKMLLKLVESEVDTQE